MTLIGIFPLEEGSIEHTFAVYDRHQKMCNPVSKSIMNACRVCGCFVPSIVQVELQIVSIWI
jgi:hypothetical protein